jgi:dihydroorotase-like cyclic amidohydrolase
MSRGTCAALIKTDSDVEALVQASNLKSDCDVSVFEGARLVGRLVQDINLTASAKATGASAGKMVPVIQL